MKLLLSDTWLSKILKKKTYFLPEKNILKLLKRNEIKKNQFIYTKIKNIKISKILKKNKFKFITTNYQCTKKITKINFYDQNCMLAKKKDLQDIKKISKSSYKFSRFHTDQRIKKKICDNIFSSWIESYFKKKRGDYILVYKVLTKVLGFLLLKKENNFILRIDLIAVDNRFKRLNIGKKIINYAKYIFYKKFSHFIVGYQGNNLEAKNFYKKLGFKINFKQDIYHYYN